MTMSLQATGIERAISNLHDCILRDGEMQGKFRECLQILLAQDTTAWPTILEALRTEIKSPASDSLKDVLPGSLKAAQSNLIYFCPTQFVVGPGRAFELSGRGVEVPRGDAFLVAQWADPIGPGSCCGEAKFVFRNGKLLSLEFSNEG